MGPGRQRKRVGVCSRNVGRVRPSLLLTFLTSSREDRGISTEVTSTLRAQFFPFFLLVSSRTGPNCLLLRASNEGSLRPRVPRAQETVGACPLLALNLLNPSVILRPLFADGHPFLIHEHVVGVHYGRHQAGVDQRF